MSEIERNKQVALRTVDEVFNRLNLAVVEEVIAADAVDHTAPPGSNVRQMMAGAAQGLREAFPDFHMSIEDLVGEGDTVAARVTMSGTHRGVSRLPGPLAGVPPTGKSFRIQQLRLMRFAGGKMVDAWSLIDWPSMLQQLGLAPSPNGVPANR